VIGDHGADQTLRRRGVPGPGQHPPGDQAGRHVHQRQHDRPPLRPIRERHPEIEHAPVQAQQIERRERRPVALHRLRQARRGRLPPVPDRPSLRRRQALPPPPDGAVARPGPATRGGNVAHVAPGRPERPVRRGVPQQRQEQPPGGVGRLGRSRRGPVIVQERRGEIDRIDPLNGLQMPLQRHPGRGIFAEPLPDQPQPLRPPRVPLHRQQKPHHLGPPLRPFPRGRRGREIPRMRRIVIRPRFESEPGQFPPQIRQPHLCRQVAELDMLGFSTRYTSQECRNVVPAAPFACGCSVAWHAAKAENAPKRDHCCAIPAARSTRAISS
jgi:hypothetical protein